MLKNTFYLKEVLLNPFAFEWSFALFMPHGVDWLLSTTCMVLDTKDTLEINNELIHPLAQEKQLHYALEIQIIQSIVDNLLDQNPHASLEEKLEAFIYYYDNDAYIQV